MIRKGQVRDIKDRASSPANQFYSLALLIAIGIAVSLGLMGLLRQNPVAYIPKFTEPPIETTESADVKRLRQLEIDVVKEITAKKW